MLLPTRITPRGACCFILFTTVDAVCVIVLVSLVLFYRKSVSTTNSFAYDESSGTVWIIQNAAGRQIAMGALAVPPNRAIASVPTPGGSVGVPPDLEAMISYPFGYVDKFEELWTILPVATNILPAL